jgi:hypothetical protein
VDPSGAPTPRISLTISSSLALVHHLLQQLGERPGLTYDVLRTRLGELERQFRIWADEPPEDAEQRVLKARELDVLREQIRAIVDGSKTRLGEGEPSEEGAGDDGPPPPSPARRG